MGSLILCHEKKAKQPYEISRIHKKIFTIEELCYYICNNLYLIDHTIINKQLCDWIMEELRMETLAKELKSSLRKNGSEEQFLLTILRASSIYTDKELGRVGDVLQHLKNQKEVERQKFKADNLLQSGETEAAVLTYLSIIHGERDETLEAKFYGKVYGCLGAAYGRMFLYEEAARMYDAAFQICEEESMLTAFIYCCRQYMTREEYGLLLSKSTIYGTIDLLLRQKEKETEIGEEITASAPEQLQLYKKEYRRMY